MAVTTATAAERKQANRKLDEGRKLLKAGKVEQAIRALQASRDIVADPEAELLLARAHQNSGELVRALAEYEQTVAEARAAARADAKYTSTLQTAERELKDLEGVVAKVTIRVRYAPPGTKVDIDGEVVDPSKLAGPIVVTPGPVRITARTPDGLETDRQLTLTAGQDAKVELAFPRQDGDAAPASVESEGGTEAAPEAPAAKSAPGSGKRVGAWVAGGVGVAGFAMFGVFGSMSKSKYRDLQGACPDGRCPPSMQDNIDAGKRDQTLANVGLAVGIAGLATSATLFFLAHQDKAGPTGQDAASEAKLELGVGLGTISLRGKFQ